jgi:hypothetical protein
LTSAQKDLEFFRQRVICVAADAGAAVPVTAPAVIRRPVISDARIILVIMRMRGVLLIFII